ncbi:hypothetical protein WP50_29780 [Lactiplantibacillus plantarum]|nr:hypothetical protein WP50_29780 [Lactiplantibacillus plantarum]
MRQESLFNPDKSSSSPLAYRVRPVTLADFKGQEHLLGPGKLYRAEVLPANLLQAQRDYFGAHTYERTDREGLYHYSWYEEQ